MWYFIYIKLDSETKFPKAEFLRFLVEQSGRYFRNPSYVRIFATRPMDAFLFLMIFPKISKKKVFRKFFF